MKIQGYKPHGFSRLECMTCGASIVRSLKAAKDHEQSQQHNTVNDWAKEQREFYSKLPRTCLTERCPRREGESLTDWTLRYLAQNPEAQP